MSSDSQPLDLYDLALLLNYETTVEEPRFRHRKLIDVGRLHVERFPFNFDPNYEFPVWRNVAGQSRRGYLYGYPPSNAPVEVDSPSNLLPTPVPPTLSHLSPRELETIFYETRNIGRCDRAVALLWLLFSKYPDDQLTRIRTSTGGMYTTTARRRYGQHWKLKSPKQLNLTVRVDYRHQAFVDHYTVGFLRMDEPSINVVLDLTSMQFGETGRGRVSDGMFVLEHIEDYKKRLHQWAREPEHVTNQSNFSMPNNAEKPPEEWMEAVVKRVKERWDNRAVEPWCGHCGAPSTKRQKLRKCTRCEVYYCNQEHQRINWNFHRHFCKGNLQRLIAAETKYWVGRQPFPFNPAFEMRLI
ncbi:hypothetical protein BT63DRAFT_465512 [Microthyrium microscopicum]|uniref:MYND-type domain-containing protein n=1 Tax=Microthyrium microscopicum TaxID=703497 RepID=A0A6A6TY07_9PEZI|nr:hypothetical protein BT63DRAFT_465512 [Microthyrium microscopicum]